MLKHNIDTTVFKSAGAWTTRHKGQCVCARIHRYRYGYLIYSSPRPTAQPLPCGLLLGRSAAEFLKIDFEKTVGSHRSLYRLPFLNLYYYSHKTVASPLGRAGNATDISNVVSFLASSESSFITGKIFIADCNAWFLFPFFHSH